MNQRSLIHVVVAVAVGYLLISAIPRQVAMYATPQPMRGEEPKDSSSPDKGGVLSPESSPESVLEDTEEIKSFETSGESMRAPTKLGDLMKWWIFDIVIALTIYLIARRRIA